MNFGSLFCGIGGFDLGLERAGMVPAWQVEINPKCRDVLRRHWPSVPHHEDVTQVGGGDLGAVDLICGGFPCQDLSVAGRRAGLAGERSGLFHEFMRIVAEIAPRWVLIENVPGLLSSNGGRDMGAVLAAMGDRGYGYTYRVLDSQFFGVPQRRRRVFVVGCAGGACPPEVLFEPESLPGDSPPSRETGQGVAGTLSPGTHPGGVTGREAESGQLVVGTLGGRRGPGPEEAARGLLVSHSITGREHKGADSDCTSGVVLAHTLRAEGHDASEDGTGRGTPIVATYQADDYHEGGYEEADTARPLTTSADRTRAAPIAFAINQRREGRVSEVRGSLHEPSGTQVDGVLSFHHSGYGASVGEQSATLQASDARLSNQVHGVIDHAIPRRLTPRECERLQAFPDDWTRYDSEGWEIADSPRYRMLGNAVTVSVAEWIGRRIVETETTK